MTPEQERWAEALAIEKWKGASAAAYVAERLVTLAAAGDQAGVARFREIAWRAEHLAIGARA